MSSTYQKQKGRPHSHGVIQDKEVAGETLSISCSYTHHFSKLNILPTVKQSDLSLSHSVTICQILSICSATETHQTNFKKETVSSLMNSIEISKHMRKCCFQSFLSNPLIDLSRMTWLLTRSPAWELCFWIVCCGGTAAAAAHMAESLRAGAPMLAASPWSMN